MSTPTRDAAVPAGAGGRPAAVLGPWLRRERETVLDALVAALVRDMPELETAPVAPRTRVRESVAVHLAALAADPGDGGPGGDGTVAVPAVVDRYTRALARRGTPALPVLLRALETMHAELWRRFVAALRSPDATPALGRMPAGRHAEVLEHVSTRLFSYFRDVSARTAAAYAAERAVLEHRAATRRAEIVAGVLDGAMDPARAGAALGYRFDATHVAFVVTAPPSAGSDRLGRLDRVAGAIVERVAAPVHLVVPAHADAVHGWIAGRDDTWRRVAAELEPPPGVQVGWGPPREGVEGFRAGHREALEACRVLEATHAATGRRCATFDDVAVVSLASRDLATARDFVWRTLGPLARDGEEPARLLDTLRHYLEERASPTRTARRLHVHPNTVVKRVERIEGHLGRAVDPTSLALRVAVELAPLVGEAPRERAQVHPVTPPSTGITVPVR